jgi:hypothetical protein
MHTRGGHYKRNLKKKRRERNLVKALSFPASPATPSYYSSQQHRYKDHLLSSQSGPAKKTGFFPVASQVSDVTTLTLRRRKRTGPLERGRGLILPATATSFLLLHQLATTAPVDQWCNFFFSSTSSSFMQYCELSSMHSSNNSRFSM